MTQKTVSWSGPGYSKSFMIYVVKAPTFILRILPPKKSVFLTSDNCLQTIPAGGICASQITKIARREGTTWNMSSPDGITPISIWVVFFLILTQWPLFSFCPRTKKRLLISPHYFLKLSLFQDFSTLPRVRGCQWIKGGWECPTRWTVLYNEPDEVS